MLTKRFNVASRAKQYGISVIAVVLLLHLFLAAPLFSQSNTGELRLKVLDPAGMGLESSVELTSEVNQVHRTYVTAAAGNAEAKNLPFGLYRIQVQRTGFVTYSHTVEIRSAVPTSLEVKLSIEPKQTTVEVNGETLVDPHRVGAVNRVGSEEVDHASLASPGR